ncbi:hypothetical protein PoB_001566400 [Plakobranchus ocellatus]|uniref:WIF domain-containing protein n=1 Tax=Plakobranchus ocellatus TaxID=259542 RepID=A0AAV3Z1H0_9GAST|nr:hypothetical protein PoB_001566400 [Plakobranchus ocellatus]
MEVLFLVSGVEYELFYVRAGVINTYALSFEMPLKPSHNHMHFTWQSLGEKPEILYDIKFNVSNPRAMGQPTTNISESGTVPREVSVFKVNLPCTGTISAEIHINMIITVKMLPLANLTRLNFRRKKVCIKHSILFGLTSIRCSLRYSAQSELKVKPSPMIPERGARENRKRDQTVDVFWAYTYVRVALD